MRPLVTIILTAIVGVGVARRLDFMAVCRDTALCGLINEPDSFDGVSAIVWRSSAHGACTTGGRFTAIVNMSLFWLTRSRTSLVVFFTFPGVHLC